MTFYLLLNSSLSLASLLIYVYIYILIKSDYVLIRPHWAINSKITVFFFYYYYRPVFDDFCAAFTTAKAAADTFRTISILHRSPLYYYMRLKRYRNV